MTFLEGVFSRGDRALAPVLEAALHRGAVLSSWEDHLRLETWYDAFAACGVDPEAYLAARDLHAPLPWDHVSPGVQREFLLRERSRALSGKTTPDCRFGACRACGVCPGERGLAPVLHTNAPTTPPPVQELDLGVRAGRYRIVYTVLGPAVYLSQLELQRVFERALRRARVPLTFSAGFHPAPLLSFGRALPVGVGSMGEWMEITTRVAMDPAALKAALGVELPQGMAVVDVVALPLSGKLPQAVEEDFSVRFSDPEAQERFGAALGRLMEVPSLVRERPSKSGGVRPVDLRAIVVQARPVPQGWVLTFSWEKEGYVSPLWVLRAMEPSLDGMEVTKVAQRTASHRATSK